LLGGTTTMMITLAVLVAAGALMLHKARASERVSTADPGSMSAQWLAEHRASHPS
jgi:hypothetical protein